MRTSLESLWSGSTDFLLTCFVQHRAGLSVLQILPLDILCLALCSVAAHVRHGGGEDWDINSNIGLLSVEYMYLAAERVGNRLPIFDHIHLLPPHTNSEGLIYYSLLFVLSVILLCNPHLPTTSTRTTYRWLL